MLCFRSPVAIKTKNTETKKVLSKILVKLLLEFIVFGSSQNKNIILTINKPDPKVKNWLS